MGEFFWKKNMHKRFDIVVVDLIPTKWHEQQWKRPSIILQNDLMSKYLGLYLIAPIASNCISVPTGLILENWKSYGLSEKSKILFHQIRVIDESRIIEKLWSVSNLQDQQAIDDKIRFTFSV